MVFGCTLYDPTDPLFLSVLALGPALGLARFGEFGRFTGSAAELTEIKYEIVSASEDQSLSCG